MILAYHVIFGTYGFWLPNDPRGSWSDFVGAWNLFRYGPATRTTERRSVAHLSHDVAQRLQAKEALSYPPVRFNEAQTQSVAAGFASYGSKSGLTIRACAILPDHVHLVLDHFRLPVEQVVIQLKGAATQQMIAENRHPFGDLRLPNGRPPKCWARGEWKVYLESEQAIRRAIDYVNENPIKEGKPRQEWSFVTPWVTPV